MKQRTTVQSAKAGQKEDITSIRFPNFIMRATAITHTGNVRSVNEDNYAMILEHDPITDTYHALFVAADGMGGHELGEEASTIVCKRHIETPQTDLAQIAKDAHRRVSALPYTQDPPGSTEIALRITHDEKESHFNVGDSRLYRYTRTQQTLDQLTEDDSEAWQEWKAGRLHTKEDARRYYRKNFITACVGAGGFDTTKTSSRPQKVTVGEVYLLCSDGLWDDLSDAQIHYTLQTSYRAAPHDHKAAAHALLNAALRAGGNDNITVILVGIDPLIQDNNEESLYKQGKEMLARKDYSGARACLEAVLLRNPKNSWAHYSLGMLYATSPLQDRDAATYHFTSALRIRPAFATKDKEEATTFVAKADYTRALWAVERAVHLAPYISSASAKKDAATLANNVGVAFKDGAAGKKDYAAAVRAFTAAIVIDDTNPDAHYHLGTIGLMQKNYVLAEQQLRRTLALNPTHRWAHYQLARTYETSGNPQARTYYQKAAALGLEQASAALQRLKR